MKTAALALLLLAACGPQWEDRDGWAMEGDVSVVFDDTQAVLDAAEAIRPCDFRWGGWLTWHAAPFACSGTSVVGCFIGSEEHSARIALMGAGSFLAPDAAHSALPHELGHYVLARCNGDYSESGAERFAEDVRARLGL